MFTYSLRPKGKRLELEKPVKFQEKGKGNILNLTNHDPQEWPYVLDIWKNQVVSDVIQQSHVYETEELFRYLETFLGDSVKAMWESYK